MRYRYYIHFLILIGALSSIAMPMFADEEKESTPLILEKMGVMFVGGRSVQMTSAGSHGDSEGQTQTVEQAPVHYLIPESSAGKNKLPVVMVPGMGLTSYLYLATPDGREGWAQYFARNGHSVYVFDEPNNAVSGFDVSQFNATNAEHTPSASARFMLWSNETVWRRWGIGSAPEMPFEDTQYPVDYIDQLYASITPVFMGTARSSQSGTQSSQSEATSGRRGRFLRMRTNPSTEQTIAVERRGGMRGGSDVKVDALIKLLEKTGPAVLVIHSASGSTGFEAVRRRPDLVRMIVAVEVVGFPSDMEDIQKHFSDKVFLGLFGDHFDVRRMEGRYDACKSMAEMIMKTGGKAEVIRLPDLGIKGNTHLMMQDKNNDEIAKIIKDRIASLK